MSMSSTTSALRAKRCARFRAIDLYPVTSEPLSAGRSTLEVLDGLLAGGATCVQLREKEKSARELFELAQAAREKTRQAGALLILNDHLDMALAVEADGVHLGQDDLPLEAARRLAPDLLLGRSTHSLEQALEAQAEGADYINIGPLFPTETKATHQQFLGAQAVEAVAARLSIPFSCMGGIKQEHLAELVGRGAMRIALVTAVTQAPDVAAATAALRRTIQEAAVDAGRA